MLVTQPLTNHSLANKCSISWRHMMPEDTNTTVCRYLMIFVISCYSIEFQKLPAPSRSLYLDQIEIYSRNGLESWNKATSRSSHGGEGMSSCQSHHMSRSLEYPSRCFCVSIFPRHYQLWRPWWTWNCPCLRWDMLGCVWCGWWSFWKEGVRWSDMGSVAKFHEETMQTSNPSSGILIVNMKEKLSSLGFQVCIKVYMGRERERDLDQRS